MTVDPEGARFRLGDAKGHYESWFLRGNHPDRPLAFWVRYTVTSPTGRPADAVAELFAIVFNGELMRHVAVRESVSMRETFFPTSGLDVRLGAARLLPDSATGRARSDGHTIAWDLKFSGGGEPLLLLPERFYAGGFPKAKALVMRPGATFTGTFEVDGEPLSVDGWRGSTNHNWGERHTDQYTWGQVAGFEGAPDTFLELASARIRIGPVLTPAMTPIVLRHEGKQYTLNTMHKLFGRAKIGGLRWTFAAKGKGVSLVGTISASPTDVVTFAYRNPPGGTKLCINSKIARCELTLTVGGRWVDLVSRTGAAFEVLVDDVLAAGRLGIVGLPSPQ